MISSFDFDDVLNNEKVSLKRCPPSSVCWLKDHAKQAVRVMAMKVCYSAIAGGHNLIIKCQ